MTIIAPYHQDEYLPALAQAVPGTVVMAELPPGPAGWSRQLPIYEAVADAVASALAPVTVVSGCCCVSLGVLAGLQRAGRAPGVVWLDAHGDVQTMQTSTSGYLGGMPLRIIAGYRPGATLDPLGLRAVPEERLVLVDARDLDPPEQDYLAASGIGRCAVDELGASTLPAGDLLLHIDLDVVSPEGLPGLRFPVAGGPSASAVLQAVRRVLATGRVVALDVAATWDPATEDPTGARAELLAALVESGPR